MNILEKAREWAEEMQTEDVRLLTTGGAAAAEVVRGLPEAWVDTEKLRKLIQEMQDELTSNPTTGDIQYGKDVSTVRWMTKLKDLLQQSVPRVEVRMGAWAMHPEHGKVMIISTVHEDVADSVQVCWEDEESLGGARTWWVDPTELSPLPDDDEKVRVLTTPEDYRSALTGTIVRESDIHVAFEKLGWNGWNGTLGEQEMDHTMGGTSRTVLWEPEPEFDPEYKYRDKDGDVWLCEPTYKRWFCKAYWLANGLEAPPADLGPYTKIGGGNEQP